MDLNAHAAKMRERNKAARSKPPNKRPVCCIVCRDRFDGIGEFHEHSCGVRREQQGNRSNHSSRGSKRVPGGILISRGEFVKLDDDDAEKAAQHSWYLDESSNGRIVRSSDAGSLASFVIGPRPRQTEGLFFINGDRRDYRRENLRWKRPINHCPVCHREVGREITGMLCRLCAIDQGTKRTFEHVLGIKAGTIVPGARGGHMV